MKYFNVDEKWRIIAQTIKEIGQPCTILDIVNKIEDKKLNYDSKRVSYWRTLAHGSERSKYINVDRSVKPNIYSLSESNVDSELMPKYLVEATVIVYEQVEMRAKNKEEAEEKGLKEIKKRHGTVLFRNVF